MSWGISYGLEYFAGVCEAYLAVLHEDEEEFRLCVVVVLQVVCSSTAIAMENVHKISHKRCLHQG